MTSEATILTSSATDPLRMIGQCGGNAARVLTEAGLPSGFFERPGACMPLRAFVDLTQGAARHLKRPDFGWRTGFDFDLRNLGPIGEAMLSSPDVGTALLSICNAFHSVQAFSELHLECRGALAILRYRVLDPEIWPRDQDAELTLATLGQVIRLAHGAQWRPDWLVFEHARTSHRSTDIRARFGVVYGAEANEMHFPVSLLCGRLPDSGADNFQERFATSRRMARAFEARAAAPVRLRQQILFRFGTGPFDQTEIAGSLGLSRRSLRRRLAHYGTSYSRVLAETRQSMARHRLEHSSIGLAEIARELGYSDQTAFERAFRREEGMTPTQFRRQSL